MKTHRHILPIIVIAQFCCTSLWFAGNAVMGDLASEFGLKSNALGHLTSAVQFGFISGTLSFAILTIADRFSPYKVFFLSAFLGALSNLGLLLESNTFWSLIGFRFLVGFFLAGIYPVGMKIAADYFDKSLGKSLGFLVGALVLGTALPHLLKDLTLAFSWKTVIVSVSGLAFLGGLLMILFIGNGPYRKPGSKFNFRGFFQVFRIREFRSAAFGYFGHMWELYTLWAFVPMCLITFTRYHPEVKLNISIMNKLVLNYQYQKYVMQSKML